MEKPYYRVEERRGGNDCLLLLLAWWASFMSLDPLKKNCFDPYFLLDHRKNTINNEPLLFIKYLFIKKNYFLEIKYFDIFFRILIFQKYFGNLIIYKQKYSKM